MPSEFTPESNTSPPSPEETIIEQGDNYTIYEGPEGRYIEDDWGRRSLSSTEIEEPSPPQVQETDPIAVERQQHEPLLGEVKPQSQEYAELVAQQYTESREATERYISAGKLADKYRLPEKIDPESLLGRRIAALSEVYGSVRGVMEKPSIVFSSLGLDLDQWDKLLSGTKLSQRPGYKGSSQGVNSHIKGIDSLRDEPDYEGLWDVSLIDAAPNPTIKGVSPDGRVVGVSFVYSDGRADIDDGAKRKFNKLADRLTEGEPITRERVVQESSPRLDVYMGLQLQLLEQGETPIDSVVSQTIGRVYTEDRPDVWRAIIFRWGRETSKVNIMFIPRQLGNSFPGSSEQSVLSLGLGVRSTVSGRDLVPK